jgi:hypothetical protein
LLRRLALDRLTGVLQECALHGLHRFAWAIIAERPERHGAGSHRREDYREHTELPAITNSDVDNNVEVIRVDDPAPGRWLIQVFARNLLRPPQDYA